MYAAVTTRSLITENNKGQFPTPITCSLGLAGVSGIQADREYCWSLCQEHRGVVAHALALKVAPWKEHICAHISLVKANHMVRERTGIFVNRLSDYGQNYDPTCISR